eukprot:284815294_2
MSSATDAMLNIRLETSTTDGRVKPEDAGSGAPPKFVSAMSRTTQALTTGQRLQYLALSVLVPWCWDRVKYLIQQSYEEYAYNIRRQAAMSRRPEPSATPALENTSCSVTVPLLIRIRPVIQLVDVLLDIAYIINFLTFLSEPTYRTLVERLLDLKISPIDEAVSRQTANLDFLRHYLTWEVFTDFLLVVVPAIDLQVLHGLMWRVARSAKKRAIHFKKRFAAPSATPVCLQEGKSPWRQFLRAWVLSPSIGLLWILQRVPKWPRISDPTSLPVEVSGHDPLPS